MKKLLAVSVLMLCLSFPAVGGHSVVDGAYCAPCNVGECICDGSDNPRIAATGNDVPSGLGSEVLLAVFGLLLLLRYRA